MNDAETPRIVAWGDSLTRGRQAGRGVSYPDFLRTALQGGREVLNMGINGDLVESIRDRALAFEHRDDDIVVIWGGTNDLMTGPGLVVPAIAQMTAALGVERCLVLSIVNSARKNRCKGEPAHTTMCAINGSLADTYGERFLDVRAMLVANHLPDDEVDKRDARHDVPPTSVRVDQIHLNERGNALVADFVFRGLLRLSAI